MSFQEFQAACREYAAGMPSWKEFVRTHKNGTYDEVYAACLMAAKQSLPYSLGEAENAMYEVLRSYHSMTPDAKLEIHHSVMERIIQTLVSDNGGYPLYIEEG